MGKQQLKYSGRCLCHLSILEALTAHVGTYVLYSSSSQVAARARRWGGAGQLDGTIRSLDAPDPEGLRRSLEQKAEPARCAGGAPRSLKRLRDGLCADGLLGPTGRAHWVSRSARHAALVPGGLPRTWSRYSVQLAPSTCVSAWWPL